MAGLMARRLIMAALGVTAIVMPLSGCGGSSGSSSGESTPSSESAPGPRHATGSPAHVMVIVEENRGRGEVIGAADMPYFNSLAHKYGNTTDWDGLVHSSLPNYLALASGSTQGLTENGCGYSFAGPTIGSQLTQAGISW